jgi:hypothetical protein
MGADSGHSAVNAAQIKSRAGPGNSRLRCHRRDYEPQQNQLALINQSFTDLSPEHTGAGECKLSRVIGGVAPQIFDPQTTSNHQQREIVNGFNYSFVTHWSLLSCLESLPPTFTLGNSRH